MNQRIPYTRPSITDLEVRFATDAAKTGWGDRCYEYIGRFEAAFRNHLGSSCAVATSSCTGAMHLGMAALGIGPGDEVIVADTNWIATVAPIVHLGATPVFVDILPDTWCIDPERAEAAITPRTKAIVAVHLYGNLCEMDELLALGARHSIPIIEDAAEALGSIYHGRKAGTLGRFGCFSFHGSKTVTTGEGGLFVTDDTDLNELVVTLSNHGRSRTQVKQFWPDVVGFKYKMSNLQAAIGCAQMERIDELLSRKRQILNSYRARLEPFPGVTLNPEQPGTRNGAWMPTAVFEPATGVTRDRLMQAFVAANIDARVFFYPVSSLPMFSPRRENTVSYDIPHRAINLPSFHEMTERDLDRIAGTIVSMFELT